MFAINVMVGNGVTEHSHWLQKYSFTVIMLVQMSLGNSQFQPFHVPCKQKLIHNAENTLVQKSC